MHLEPLFLQLDQILDIPVKYVTSSGGVFVQREDSAVEKKIVSCSQLFSVIYNALMKKEKERINFL